MAGADDRRQLGLRYIWELFPETHQVNGEPQNIYVQYEGGPIPLAKLPAWKPEMINGGYTQDDLYVEVPFMETLRDHGVNAGWEPLGTAFANTQFPLWHANDAARKNLRAGIPAPLSGHYRNGGESDDIDWQIESDFVGLMNPGQLHSAAETAFRIGHVMNYGDGVYGGVFVASMISRAFTARSVREIVDAGCTALPAGSKYRIVVDEVIAAYERGASFDENLAALNERWGTQDRCTVYGGAQDPLNIDAKLNGAYILLGLLYGEGDLARSMQLAMACGQDSDCNPSNVGSILGAYYGRDTLAAPPHDWLTALDLTEVFQTTPYRLEELVELNVEIARAVVQFKGGVAPVGQTWQLPLVMADETLILEQWPEEANDTPRLTASAVVTGDRTVCVEAHATDADGVRAYQWFFGDLTFKRGPCHLHTYRHRGEYELVACVADTTGNTSYEIFTLTIR